jgi:hypothetical protein
MLNFREYLTKDANPGGSNLLAPGDNQAVLTAVESRKIHNSKDGKDYLYTVRIDSKINAEGSTNAAYAKAFQRTVTVVELDKYGKAVTKEKMSKGSLQKEAFNSDQFKEMRKAFRDLKSEVREQYKALAQGPEGETSAARQSRTEARSELSQRMSQIDRDWSTVKSDFSKTWQARRASGFNDAIKSDADGVKAFRSPRLDEERAQVDELLSDTQKEPDSKRKTDMLNVLNDIRSDLAKPEGNASLYDSLGKHIGTLHRLAGPSTSGSSNMFSRSGSELDSDEQVSRDDNIASMASSILESKAPSKDELLEQVGDPNSLKKSAQEAEQIGFSVEVPNGYATPAAKVYVPGWFLGVGGHEETNPVVTAQHQTTTSKANEMLDSLGNFQSKVLGGPTTVRGLNSAFFNISYKDVQVNGDQSDFEKFKAGGLEVGEIVRQGFFKNGKQIKQSQGDGLTVLSWKLAEVEHDLFRGISGLDAEKLTALANQSPQVTIARALQSGAVYLG